MKMEIDASEVRQLAVDFRQVPDALARRAKPAVVRGAVNIKEQLSAEMASSASFGALSGMSFDLTDGGYAAEIGIKTGGSGRAGLGFGANIAYFGGANGGGGTVPDPMGALEAEAPKFAKALSDLAADLLR